MMKHTWLLMILVFSVLFEWLSGQDGPKAPQDGPKTPQDGPKTPQDGPKTPPEGPKTAPRGPPNKQTIKQATKQTNNPKKDTILLDRYCVILLYRSHPGPAECAERINLKKLLSAEWDRLSPSPSCSLARTLGGVRILPPVK